MTARREEVLHTRSGAELRIGAHVVVKRHREGTDARCLAARVAAAGVVPELLTPIHGMVQVDGDARCVTRWPRDSRLPWKEWGRLLARLHRTPLVPSLRLLPKADPWARLDRALTALEGHVSKVRGAVCLLGTVAAALPRDPVKEAVLVHGDIPAGQLGLTSTGWVLLDVDDLGLGDPAWDLARPAGFWAAGLLPDDGWRAFLEGYFLEGGPAADVKDPWICLDTPARAAVVAAAAYALDPTSPTAEDRDALLDACAAMRRSDP